MQQCNFSQRIVAPTSIGSGRDGRVEGHLFQLLCNRGHPVRDRDVPRHRVRLLPDLPPELRPGRLPDRAYHRLPLDAPGLERNRDVQRGSGVHAGRVPVLRGEHPLHRNSGGAVSDHGCLRLLLPVEPGRAGRGDTRVLSPFSVLASVSGILGIYLVLVWGEGVGLHYLLIGLYKNIFL